MKHLGDITKISGHTAPIVDCIIGGSPCQDLSVAGKRAGLDGERSGLFMDQIRIIKEMREEDERRGNTDVDIRPRYMVWENVPGAFSSNKGEDFRVVLEETAKVADKDAVIPQPDKGKWANAGCIVGKGWSIAWRVLDAQFWGVPQRRRRIALVADFGGQSASEILFVRQSVSGNTQPSEPKRKGTSSDAEGSTGESDFKGDNVVTFEPGIASTGSSPKVITIDQGGGKSACNVTEGQAPTLTCTHGGEPAVCYSIENHPADSRVNIDESGKVQTLTSRMETGGGNVPMVMEHSKGDVIALDRASYNQGKNAQYNFEISDKGINSPLVAKGPGAVAYVDTSHADDVVRMDDVVAPLQARDYKGGKLIKTNYIVRRLTPLECERLQGFPDGWTDIGEWVDSKGKVKKTSDSARYKALGNSIALPPWKFVLKRLCACYERDATMASLFDGIGGFPYIWEQLNGKGSCLWASEIEEFPMAVTKARFNEE